MDEIHEALVCGLQVRLDILRRLPDLADADIWISGRFGSADNAGMSEETAGENGIMSSESSVLSLSQTQSKEAQLQSDGTTAPSPGPEYWSELATAVLRGETLTRANALEILNAPDEHVLAILDAAWRVRREYFGRSVQLYYLKNAKSGLCPEDCTYCSQSKISGAEIDKYPMLNAERLLEGARKAAESQARTYCIVASGRGPSDREVDHVAGVVRQIKQEYGLHICCCLGLLKPDQAVRLKAAGVDRINHNLNTSERYHEQICTTHTFRDRLQTLDICRDAGLELCAGMIVGMGETLEDVADVALKLAELQVESIPLNFLNSIEGTPLQSLDHLNPRFCLKVLAMFRLTNPRTELRIAGGREVNLRSMQAMGLYAANSMFVSDYLTTPGQQAIEDFRMIRDLGFEITAGDYESAKLLDRWNEPHATAPAAMTEQLGGCDSGSCGH